MPALPTIRRPGSKISMQSRSRVARLTSAAYASGSGGGSLSSRYGIPRPPPRSMCSMWCPSARSPRTKSDSKANASSNGDNSVIWLPMCMSTPVTRRPGVFAATADRDGEFILGFAGCDLGVGFRIDVGIDPNRDVGGPPLASRNRREELELRLRLDIDAQDAGIDRSGEFGRALPDAGEHDPVGRNAGGERALEFSARHNVGPGTEPRQGGDHGLIGVGLHGVANERAHVGERVAENPIVALKRGGGIAVERRADARGKL